MSKEFVQYKYNNRGVASLPVLLALSAVMVVLGMLISSMSFADNLDSQNAVGAEKSLANAQIGARDALIRLSRDKNYAGTYSIDTVAGGCVAPFSGCATLTVDASMSPKAIQSVGKMGASTRTVNVYLYMDSNGQFLNYNWQEL